MPELWRKLSSARRRVEIDADLQEEMRTHIEMRASDSGDPDAARRQFGNTTLLLEDSRAAWGWPQLESWLRDFRFALRGLARRPAFAATVVFTLALGIGASSTIYSLIDAVLVRSLPYPHSERIAFLEESKPADQRSHTPVAPGRLEDWQNLNSSFEFLAGSHVDSITDTTGQIPERLSAAFVSPQFFSVLQTSPSVGRVFTPEEERYGGPQSVIISDGLWRRRFAADPNALGRTLILADLHYVIAGVMPPQFQYPAPTTEIWIPKQAQPALMQIREARFYQVIGRLKPGVTLEQAQADLAAVQQKLGVQYPKTDSGWTVAMEPLKERIVGKIRLVLWLLFGSVTLLLLITCANVACLLLARLNSRSAEIATRRSLGAGRAAIARQLFAEGLVYGLAGGFLGMAATFAGIDYLRKRLPEIPRISELAVDTRMLAVGAAISLLAAVLFSLAPILQTFRRDLAAALIQGGRSVVGTRQRLPRFLVSAQLALATALLIGAGLFLRSLMQIHDTPLGFQPANILTLHVAGSFNESPDSVAERHRRILDSLSAIPGVTAVSMSTGLPGVSPAWPREFEIAGEAAPGGLLRFTSWRIVTSDYFQTIGIPLTAGRTCRMNPDPKQPFETLVNRGFAARYFQNRDPIGHSIQAGPQGDVVTQIVGVVADAREDGQNTEPQPMIYACGFLRYWPDSDYLIQTRTPAGIANSAREAIRVVEPARPVYSVRLLEDALQGALSQTRFRTLLISLFSILALTLAAIGLYGVMAYMVVQRTREIGIRLALGALPGQIVGEILRSGGVLAIAGAIAGVALAGVSAKLLGTLLYGVRPSDPTSFVSGTGVLLVVALLSCLIPARRATRIDPTQALREQ